MNQEISLIFLAILLYGGFIAAFIFSFQRRIQKRGTDARFFKALASVVRSEKSVEGKVDEIDLIFKRLSENSRYVFQQVHGPEDLIETFIYLVDTGEHTYLKRIGVDPTDELKEQSMALLEAMRSIRPFSRLAPKEANVLSTLDQAIQANNPSLSRTLLRQVAEEFELSGAVLRKMEKEKQIATMISAIGVVLTLVFGLMSFVL